MQPVSLLEQQLCRCLLTFRDRLLTDNLNITHQQIADFLGVRRESVTVAAGEMQRAGLIHCRREHITVSDRSGLEARVCECYQVVKRELDRLLPDNHLF